MVLIRAALIALLALGLHGPSPSWAHENHQRAQIEAPKAAAPAAASLPPSEIQQRMEAHGEDMEAQRPKTFPERLTSWFGRMHPFAVHFPIALFPVALIALILARRRGETVSLIRALIVVGGAGAALAAILGWLNGGLTVEDTDTVLMMHRWLGTALGAMGAVLAWRAWRSPAAVDGSPMVGALAVTVVLLLVQGFLGASVTHGMEHMMF